MMIRTYEDKDLDGVRSLFEERNLEFDSDIFLWKKHAPDARSWVGEDKGRIVAHYSILEMPLLARCRSGFGVDGIFAKTHSQLPTIQQLLRHALEYAAADGLDVVVAFANERMGAVKRFLGWKSVGMYHWRRTDAEGSPELILGRSFDRDTACKESYEHWRWQESPREYGSLKADGRVISIMAVQDDSPPLLLWHDAIQWTGLNTRFDFRYLGSSSIEAQVTPSSPIVQPLYYSLNDEETTLEWPNIWPLETVEGVTLGW